MTKALVQLAEMADRSVLQKDTYDLILWHLCLHAMWGCQQCLADPHSELFAKSCRNDRIRKESHLLALNVKVCQFTCNCFSLSIEGSYMFCYLLWVAWILQVKKGDYCISGSSRASHSYQIRVNYFFQLTVSVGRDCIYTLLKSHLNSLLTLTMILASIQKLSKNKMLHFQPKSSTFVASWNNILKSSVVSIHISYLCFESP